MLDKTAKSNIHYVLWEVTQKCNLRCIHCRANASPDKKEGKLIKSKDAFNLLDDIAKLGCPALALTGGEPLLRQDIIGIVSYATSKKIPTRIQSNGLLLTEQVADKLKKAGLMSFGIGLDGSNSSIHDKIRNQRGAFNGAIKAIRILKAKNIKVHVEFTINRINFNDLVATLDLLESLGVDTFLARAVIFKGRATLDNSIFRLSSSKYKKILELIYKERGKRKIILNCQDPLYHLVDKNLMEKLKTYGNIYSGKILTGCTAGLNMIHIHSNGDVGVCTFLNLIIGNVFEKSLLQIWRERFSVPEIKRLINREYEGFCKNCSDRFICGGCRARALCFNNNIFGQDPYCWKYGRN